MLVKFWIRKKSTAPYFPPSLSLFCEFAGFYQVVGGVGGTGGCASREWFNTALEPVQRSPLLKTPGWDKKYHRSGGGAVVETGHDKVKRSAGDQLSSAVAGRTAHTRGGIVGHGGNCAEKVSAGTGIKTSASTRGCRWRE